LLQKLLKVDIKPFCPPNELTTLPPHSVWLVILDVFTENVCLWYCKWLFFVLLDTAYYCCAPS